MRPGSPLKAFIHDRKPRNVSHNGPQSHGVGVKEDLHSSSEEDAAAANDQYSVGNSQELSSQASSAEPQTPSPQYSSARVHQSTFDSSIDSSTPDPARQAPHFENSDSHLASLLNNLQRSAASLALDEAPKSQLATTEPAVPVLTRHAPDVSPDWSAHVPVKRSAQVNIPHPFAASLPAALSPQVHDRSMPLHPTPQESRSSAAPPTTSPSLRPLPSVVGHARRGSAADISPYLAHPRNITKEMRYISILESVAQESDRAASRMSHRSPMVPSLQSAQVLLPQAQPFPPAGLDQSIIYSSSVVQQQVPRALHPMHQPPLPEGLVGRPQTSHAFHGAPYTGSGVPRQSMNEHQLRSMLPLNGQWNDRPAPSFASPYPVHAPPALPLHARPPTSPARSVPPYQYPSPHIGQSSSPARIFMMDVI